MIILYVYFVVQTLRKHFLKTLLILFAFVLIQFFNFMFHTYVMFMLWYVMLRRYVLGPRIPMLAK